MNWNDLKIFLAVSRRGRLSLAAADLRLDETTVSRRLKRLEDDMGQTLFERLRTGHQLTVYGSRLLAQAEHIEQAMEAMKPAHDAAQNQPTGTIRISVAEGFGAALLSPILGQFTAQYPEIDIELVSGSGFLSLSKREADVAIGLSRSKSAKITSDPLTPYKLHLYGTPQYLNERGAIRAVQDLADHVLIDYIDDLLYSDELRYFEETVPNIRPKIRSTSIIAQARLVSAGTGLAILPDFLAKPDFVKVLPGRISLTRQFWFSAHQSVSQLAKTKAFREFVFQHLKGV